MPATLENSTILITGATGSFGTALSEHLLAHHAPRSLRLFSRDEFKQDQLAHRLAHDERVRFLIGDVRDRDRLCLAARGVDVIIHAAAMKQVPACEYNPSEAVATNIGGAENVVAAALANDVPRTMALSTDKAVNPVNLYGATKLAAEKLVTAANAYAGDASVRFANVRYGNVVGSRGSVVPLFRRQAAEGSLTITDERMTRFWLTLDQAIVFVLGSLASMGGGEVYVPKLPSMRVVDLAHALAPGVPTRTVGIRAGEKLHEVMVTEDESRNALDVGDRYVIYPDLARATATPTAARACAPDFRYSSDVNDRWLTTTELHAMLGEPAAVVPIAA